jgi:hypothetical protein
LGEGAEGRKAQDWRARAEVNSWRVGSRARRRRQQFAAAAAIGPVPPPRAHDSEDRDAFGHLARLQYVVNAGAE